jgi:release factor glutamine methyltransferase
MTKSSIQDWLRESTILVKNISEHPILELNSILASVLERKREWLVTHSAELLSLEQIRKLNNLRGRLINGEPLPYLVGKQAFFGLDFIVTPAVLIPRPETELLIEEAIAWLELNPRCRKAVDVGTGSGAIAVALADRFSNLIVSAIDISDKALDVARQNSFQLNVDKNITFFQGNLLDGIEEKFNLIAANLPYIPTKTLEQSPALRFEPSLALDGGKDGLDLIRALLKQSTTRVTSPGLILLEIEASQGETCRSNAAETFPNAKIDILQDLADLPRIIKIIL